jgi:preprotein translocase subunit YajC
MAKRKSKSNNAVVFAVLALVLLGIFLYFTYTATQQTQTQDSEAARRRVQPASSDVSQIDSLLEEVNSVSETNSPLYFTDLNDLESENE